MLRRRGGAVLSSRKITIEHLIASAIEARLATVHVSLPCKVDSYDVDKNTVNLIPLLKRKRRSTKDGTTRATQIASLQNVPVAFFRTSKGWFTLPITKGDVGMVVFAERSLKDWMGKAKGEIVEPVDETKHPLDGAWFYPGGYPSKSPINPTNGDHVVIGLGSGAELHLGEAGLSDDNLVALAKLVKDELSAMRTTINSNNIIFNTMVLPSGMGPVGPPPVSMQDVAPINDVKATKVKAK